MKTKYTPGAILLAVALRAYSLEKEHFINIDNISIDNNFNVIMNIDLPQTHSISCDIVVPGDNND